MRIGVLDSVVPFGYQLLLLEHALDLVSQSGGQVAESGVFGLGVLCREEDGTAAKVDVPDLNLDELADPTAQFVHHFKHELVLVIVDAVKEQL